MMAHETLPPGSQNASGPIKSIEDVDQYHMGWVVQVLPYLDQGNMYNHVDFTKSVYAKENADVRARRMPIMTCPSDHGGGRYSTTAGVTNYNGVHNDFEAPIDVNQNGVMFLNSSVRHEQVKDGCSNTIFVMEARQDTGSDLGWMSGTRATLRNGVVWANQGVANATPLYSVRISEGGAAIRKELDDLKAGTEVVGGPSSYHVGGYHVVLGDGAVRFISQNVNTPLLRNLCHRADGEIVDEF
jgi:hypothetical protein